MYGLPEYAWNVHSWSDRQQLHKEAWYKFVWLVGVHETNQALNGQ